MITLSRHSHLNRVVPLRREEVIIQNALRAYSLDVVDGSVKDFVPAEVLYQAYLKEFREGTWPLYDARYDDDTELVELTRRQFGYALRRATAVRKHQRVRRIVKGKKIWGYSHVIGPGSVRVREKSGRPLGAKGRKVQ